ncbi:MAG: shikimate dehydrogenase [bacterium]|nr:shikimate dehydrogenase [bacterium]
MKIDGHTKQLGIIGCPVEHTFSPKLQNFISERMEENYVYSAWHVEPEKLEDAIAGMKALNIRGLNVTAPHKKAVMQYLDVISEQAQLLGSVNTVVNKNGRLYGYNTDAEGFYAALYNEGIFMERKNILIIGAGGVVKPTLMRIIQENPLSVTVVNRTKSKVIALKNAIKEQMDFEINTDFKVFEHYDIVINATSAGMEPQLNALPIDGIDEIDSMDFIDKDTAVVDMIYNPKHTLFLKEARKRGAKTMNGLGMLIHQGLIAHELFTGNKLPKDMADIVMIEVFRS